MLRYGLFYGPGTWYAPHGLMADRARAGTLEPADDIVSFLHVDDAATAAIDALTWPSGAVNVCDDDPASGREWVPAFCRAVGAPAAPLLHETPARAAWARGADNGRARTLGWAPRYRSWREGFASLTPTRRHAAGSRRASARSACP